MQQDHNATKEELRKVRRNLEAKRKAANAYQEELLVVKNIMVSMEQQRTQLQDELELAHGEITRLNDSQLNAVAFVVNGKNTPNEQDVTLLATKTRACRGY
ncbi:hypothetical protein BU23DRAFT_569122 [Bimuria novae-zelandiae CBS 107.79]|uniref:Uncharacterized protein n=1 Tax=Bimuria novae-zelandiae CBS 107.79 TaxID=1447943 RepID=A0A6A5V513_9PLEO|nr:hypothetical protein BU23DRAFT_569122 [Bimuria novae-zelandiae CBS 107.79]